MHFDLSMVKLRMMSCLTRILSGDHWKISLATFPPWCRSSCVCQTNRSFWSPAGRRCSCRHLNDAYTLWHHSNGFTCRSALWNSIENLPRLIGYFIWILQYRNIGWTAPLAESLARQRLAPTLVCEWMGPYASSQWAASFSSGCGRAHLWDS